VRIAGVRIGLTHSVVVLGLAIVFGLALWLRLIGLGGAVTEDEDQWIARSGTFARSLIIQDWDRTFLTGHPGVTVMWLTSVTLGLDRTAPFAFVPGGPDVTVQPGFLPALLEARVPFAVIQALLVAVSAGLVVRLFGVGPGLLAGLLMAAEPFWVGVGPIVGMDGLLSGLLTVSLLGLLVALLPDADRRERLAWTVLSGLAFGLACLTKTTALLAGPMMAVLVVLAAWEAWRGSWAQRDRRWLTPLVLGLGWGIVAVLVIWLAWPSAWVAPIETAVATVTFSAELGTVPHGPGNFFLGRPVEDPGAAFYPVALVLRMGSGTTVGLLLLLTFGAPPAWRRTVWTLLGYCVWFLVALTFAAKKVDRYLLPVLPVLAILAAVGWYEGGRWLAGGWQRRQEPGARSGPAESERGDRPSSLLPTAYCLLPTAYCLLPTGARAVAMVAFGVQVWPLVMAGRYPLAAYNPLFGGVRMAERSIPVGWGDGLDVAGDMIRQIVGDRTVVTSIWGPLRVNFGAHAPGPVVNQLQAGEADFYVDYIDARQRRVLPRQVLGRKPEGIVTIGGVDYARIYRLR